MRRWHFALATPDHLTGTPAVLVGGRDRRTAGRHRRGPGIRGRSSTRPTRDRGTISCTRADVCSTRSPTSPLARSVRRRPRRYPRRSVARATGTTATRGCATRASPSRRCGSPRVPTRPTSSSTSCREQRRRSCGAVPTCRSCSASAASAISANGSCRTSPGGVTARRCGWGTARGISVSSTSTANSSTRPTDCPTSSTGSRRRHDSSSPISPTPPPLAGRSRTRESGRCAARRATSCTPSSCAGSRSTGRSGSPTGSVPPIGSTTGRACATRSPTPSSRAAGTNQSARSPSRSAPTISTPRT